MIGSAAHHQRIAFRADASLEIGTGHVMRCLTLANALRERGAECLFLCRPHPGHLMEQIAAHGHRVLALSAPRPSMQLSPEGPAHASWLGTDWETDAAEARQTLAGEGIDWLVVDHYALDYRWEWALRLACRHLMVMDDLADRMHDCDLLLDPSLGRTLSDYDGLVTNGSITLLGPRYALLRPEFAALRAESLARRKTGVLRRLLITMGGVDKDNATGRVLDALDATALPSDLKITVVMGARAPWLCEVRARAHKMHAETDVQVGVKDMARLMTDCDLAIGAAGGTAWERCCLGLPTFVMCLADNQYEMAKTLQASGAVTATKDPCETAWRLSKHYATGTLAEFLIRSSGVAALVTDGQGTERACREMLA